MGALTTPSLMTVEEFDKIPDPPGARLELRHGVPVPVTFPRKHHVSLQKRLARLLEQALPSHEVMVEMPFRPLPRHELWAADVAALRSARWDATDESGWVEGSPEIVVEVLSPSNTAEEMDDRERTCFAGSAEQFWVVYPKGRYVRVAFPDGRTVRYEVGEKIPAGDGYIDVAEIFSVLD